MNIQKCPNCKGSFISEEYQTHECGDMWQSFDTDGNRWGSYDGQNWFSLPPFNQKPSVLPKR